MGDYDRFTDTYRSIGRLLSLTTEEEVQDDLLQPWSTPENLLHVFERKEDARNYCQHLIADGRSKEALTFGPAYKAYETVTNSLRAKFASEAVDDKLREYRRLIQKAAAKAKEAATKVQEAPTTKARWAAQDVARAEEDAIMVERNQMRTELLTMLPVPKNTPVSQPSHAQASSAIDLTPGHRIPYGTPGRPWF